MDKISTQYQDWYQDVVTQGSDSFAKFHHHLKKQLEQMPPLSGKRVLEVGCGKGEVSLYLALFSGARSVVALDEALGEGAPVGVNQALRDAMPLFGVDNLTVIDADIMRNGFSDGTFDIIIANNALHHINDSGLISDNPSIRNNYVNMFIKLKHLLAANGILSFYEYSRLSFWRWSPIKFKWKVIDWELHPTRGEWLSVIQKAGFSVQSCNYCIPYPLRHFEKLLANPFAQFMLTPSFIFTALK
jgi:SAM-dependent methyltransferase